MRALDEAQLAAQRADDGRFDRHEDQPEDGGAERRARPQVAHAARGQGREAEHPVAGDQVYEPAPLAERVVLLPVQILESVADAVTVGLEFTVTVTCALLVQPLALLPVTV